MYIYLTQSNILYHYFRLFDYSATIYIYNYYQNLKILQFSFFPSFNASLVSKSASTTTKQCLIVLGDHLFADQHTRTLNLILELFRKSLELPPHSVSILQSSCLQFPRFLRICRIFIAVYLYISTSH